MRRRDCAVGSTRSPFLIWAALAVVLCGCSSLSGALTTGAGRPASPPPVDLAAAESPATADAVVAPSSVPEPATAPDSTIDVNFGPRLTQWEREAGDVALEAPEPWQLAGPAEELAGGFALLQRPDSSTDMVDEEYDPWEPFNEKMFAFNRNLDRFVLKPAARAYMFIMPEPWQVLIANGFDNINFVPRFVNSLLQGKWGGAGRELGRFLINSTAGIGGLFDPAKDYWGIQKSREDFGQTLGVWGSGPGPYLILPFLEPLTVRDGIGKFVDGLMDPLSYVLPFFWTRAGMKAGDVVNDRALNYELFQGFEESVIDMYSAVRHGYLQRRRQLIKE